MASQRETEQLQKTSTGSTSELSIDNTTPDHDAHTNATSELTLNHHHSFYRERVRSLWDAYTEDLRDLPMDLRILRQARDIVVNSSASEALKSQHAGVLSKGIQLVEEQLSFTTLITNGLDVLKELADEGRRTENAVFQSDKTPCPFPLNNCGDCWQRFLKGGRGAR